MKKHFFIIVLLSIAVSSFAQNVTNVTAEQVGKNIVVSYDLDKTATISVCYSTDRGKTYSSSIKQVTGDVGRNISAGHKSITWDVLSEVEKLVCSNLVFKVSAGGGSETFTVNGVPFEMVYVEGGTFTMGATSEQGSDAADWEKPTHSVMLSDFAIGKYEVTQELWEAVMGNNPSYSKGSTKPVEGVSWDDCQSFISKLNSLLSSQLDDKRFALPTEAQWEYAARGGKMSQGYKYAGSNSISSVAWYSDNSGSSTHEVGTKSPNELGLYDMSGNVYEWCQDRYGSYSSSLQSNPTGPSLGSNRVYRGGSWFNYAGDGRVSFRSGNTPSIRRINLGFRLVLLP